MNIYGDNGNLRLLVRRLEWYGYEPVVISYNVGDTLLKTPILLAAADKDSGQEKFMPTLLKSDTIKKMERIKHSYADGLRALPTLWTFL